MRSFNRICQALQLPTGDVETTSLRNQIISLQNWCTHIDEEKQTLGGDLITFQKSPCQLQQWRNIDW